MNVDKKVKDLLFSKIVIVIEHQNYLIIRFFNLIIINLVVIIEIDEQELKNV